MKGIKVKKKFLRKSISVICGIYYQNIVKSKKQSSILLNDYNTCIYLVEIRWILFFIFEAVAIVCYFIILIKKKKVTK